MAVPPSIKQALLALNSPQRKATTFVDKPLLVLAGAGSGKTRVITHKIAYLIEEKSIDAKNIFAVTFTNKAAREMKQRISKITAQENTKGLNVSTFHRLGLEILRKEAKHLGFKKGMSIFDTTDSLNTLREAMRDARKVTSAPDEVIRWQISAWKNDAIHPEEAIRIAKTPAETDAALLYGPYNERLKTYNAVDFDDLILLPVQAFEKDPEMLYRWQQKVQYMLVDEYQDTNLAQYSFVKLLVGNRKGLTVVGDDDQSIYTWRGAKPENLVKLNHDFPDMELIKLEQNYRSYRRILHCANRLISNNPHVFEKNLWSELGHGDPLRVIPCKDDIHEAETIVSEIIAHQFQHRTQFGDYAILYRGNHQAKPLEQVLRTHRVSYQLSGGQSFFDRSEIKDLMSYLRILTNDNDDQAFLRIVNKPRREIGQKTIQQLTEFASEQAISLFNACFHDDLANHLPKRAQQNLREFAEWIVQLEDLSSSDTAHSVIKQLLSDIDYETWLMSTAVNEKDGESRVKNVSDFLEWIKRLQSSKSGDKTLKEIVTSLVLLDVLDRDDDTQNNNQLQLMTLHAAKGLEFPYVFIAGMEEELLPHRNSIDENNIEEERRLAYVGITRAQRQLTFTYAGKRKRAGEWLLTEPSRFLDEIPKDDLSWKGEETDPVESHNRGKAHLANLRSLLDA